MTPPQQQPALRGAAGAAQTSHTMAIPTPAPCHASLGLAGLQLPLHGPNARVWGASIAARAWQVGIRHTIP